MNTPILFHFLRRFQFKKVSSVIAAVKSSQLSSINNSICLQPPLIIHRNLSGKMILPAGLLSFFFKDEKEETPEEKLINTIKRSILCIQREQHEKAEQMLHLALRMAQDLQSKDGITYVFDVMGNLALEQGQYQKAEKLFVAVMQRLLSDGCAEDDIKMLHISSKIAEIRFQSGDLEVAEMGFKFTIENLDKKIAEHKEDSELLELWGIVKESYAQLLMVRKKFNEAKQCLIQAYDTFCQLHGKNNPEAATLLNNLAVVCTNTNELVQAEVYLTEAIQLSKEFPELRDSGIFEANRGMLFIKQGLVDKAKKSCSLAWRSAKKSESAEGVMQADYCLKQLKELKV